MFIRILLGVWAMEIITALYTEHKDNKMNNTGEKKLEIIMDNLTEKETNLMVDAVKKIAEKNGVAIDITVTGGK